MFPCQFDISYKICCTKDEEEEGQFLFFYLYCSCIFVDRFYKIKVEISFILLKYSIKY